MHSSVGDFVLAVLLMLAFTFAMAWIGVLLGLLAPTVEIVQQLGFLIIFPLTFLSNAFVPTETLPAGLQTVADWNPISALVSATRDLFGNPNPYPSDSWPAQHALLLSVVWTVGLVVVVRAARGPALPRDRPLSDARVKLRSRAAWTSTSHPSKS